MADHGPIEVWCSTRIGSVVYMFRTTRSPVLEPNPARAFIQVGRISLRHPVKGWRRARDAWSKVNAYVRAVECLNDPPYFKPPTSSSDDDVDRLSDPDLTDAEADALIDALSGESQP